MYRKRRVTVDKNAAFAKHTPVDRALHWLLVLVAALAVTGRAAAQSDTDPDPEDPAVAGDLALEEEPSDEADTEETEDAEEADTSVEDPDAAGDFVDEGELSDEAAEANRPRDPDRFETDALPHGAHDHLVWPDEWGSFGMWDYGLLGGALAVTVATQLIGPLQSGGDPQAGAGWQRSSRLDEIVRRRMRRDDLNERGRIRDASDMLLSLTVSFSFLFDGLVSAFWYHESPEVGRQLTLLAIEVQFISAAIQSTSNMIASRVRPYVRDCGGELPESNGDCTGSVRFRSYFSGHTSQAFAGAVTSCVFHAKFDLYGGGSADVLPCVGLLASATAVGVFRMMGDMHYITDVFSGAIMGSAVGAIVPLLRMRDLEKGRRVSIVPNGLGLAVVGSLR